MSVGDLIEKFRAVAIDRVERMNVLLVQLEQGPDDDDIEELTREIHTLKGEAKMMGFADVNLVAHLTEHLMLDAASVEFLVAGNDIQMMFEGLDVLRALLTKEVGGASAPIDLAGFVDRVSAARGESEVQTVLGETTPGGGEDDADPRPPAEPSEAADVSSSAIDTTSPGLDRETKSAPDGFDRPKTVRSKVVDSSLLRIQTSGSARVDLAKLERLGESTGEILLTARRLGFHLSELEELRDEYQQIRNAIEHLLPKALSDRTRSFSHRFDGVLGELRQHVAHAANWAGQLDGQTRELRHTPLDQALQHYPRAVRDLAASQGKKVRFDQDVSGVEVDRVVLNGLADPLLHMVRNAVDHGVEPPRERERAGKPREGRIKLVAEYVGDSIRVTLADDGRGIDPTALGKKAVEKGILSGAEVAVMTDEELIGLIFEAGFSTRDDVSDVSGRGIGMHVVRREIGEIGGTVELESEVGSGTTFTLVLPVSSAVGSVLTFVVAGQAFAVPAQDVERVEFVQREDLEPGENSILVPWEDEMVPLLDWQKLLGEEQMRGVPRGRFTTLFVRRGGRAVAVWVDDVVGERDAITRPLGHFLAGLRICRGMAMTDAGEIVPLLNVNELLSAENTTPSDQRRSVRATLELPRAPRKARILVVEDSEITRALVSGILRGMDHEVVEAEDGWEGWEQLERGSFDLVMSDVQMPRMSGLELLARIRGDDHYDNLPVVILTTLGEASDKKKALDLGADAYLVKLNFEEQELIRTVRRLLG